MAAGVIEQVLPLTPSTIVPDDDKSSVADQMPAPTAAPGVTGAVPPDNPQPLSWAERWSLIRPHILPVLQAFMIQFITGINDGNLGIVLPSIKAYYGLTQYAVSTIFLCNTCGFMIAAVSNGYLVRYLSQSRTALLGSSSMIVGYLVILFAVPFPVMCIFMTFIGFGVALTQASSNVVCGEMPNNTLMLSFLHAFFGAGGLLGPLLGSGVIESGKPWNTSYMIMCGLAGANTISMAFCYRKLRTRSEREAEVEALQEKRSLAISSTSTTVPANVDPESLASETASKNPNLLAQILKYRISYIGCVFLLFYTGTEVTIGNWGYTFLISARSTDTSAMAHIMSGYWAGICAGRLFLGFVTSRYGEKRMVYIYLSVIVVMLVLLWVVPYVGANATALVITGIALAPIFPTTVSVAHSIIPTNLYPTAIGFLSAFASAGTALFPYATGVLIGAKGVQSMLPFCVALSGCMFILWIFMPGPKASHGGSFVRTIINRLRR